MNNCSPVSQVSGEGLSRRDFRHVSSQWLMTGQIEGWSERTIGDRRIWIARVAAFLDKRDRDFDTDGLRELFVAFGHGDRDFGCVKKPKPASLQHVWTILHAFGEWAVSDSILDTSPMRRVPKPAVPDPLVKPFEPEELDRLLKAAAEGRYRERDRAMLLTFLDTGARLSEVAALRVADLDIENGLATIRRGKGGRGRTVSYGVQARRALWAHLRKSAPEPADFLFVTERGNPFCVYSVRDWIQRLGTRAGVADAHCHRLRHTAAISYLRNGATQLAVMHLLGHKSATMTQRYCAMAESDLQALAANCAPGDRLGAKGKNGR